MLKNCLEKSGIYSAWGSRTQWKVNRKSKIVRKGAGYIDPRLYFGCQAAQSRMGVEPPNSHNADKCSSALLHSSHNCSSNIEPYMQFDTKKTLLQSAFKQYIVNKNIITYKTAKPLNEQRQTNKNNNFCNG